MAEQFSRLGLPSVAVSRRELVATSATRRCGTLNSGVVRAVFTVDLFNEGIDVPDVDTLLLLRPTDSPTLFLQQLGRGLRKAPGKTVCTVLDFVGTHRKEFRFDRRFRALLGGSRLTSSARCARAFRSCRLVATSSSTRSLRRSSSEHPRRDPERLARAMRRAARARRRDARRVPRETGLELEDIYAGNHSWSEMRRAAGLPTAAAGPNEDALLRAVGRLLHVDDDERIDAYRALLRATMRAVDRRARASAINDCFACWSAR